MLPILLALAAFHVPVTCDMAVPAPPNQAAQGVYHASVLPNGHLAQNGAIQLLPQICDALDQGRAQIWPQYEETANALFVLAHELAHSYGIRGEDGADCVGAQLLGFTARKLHYPAARLTHAAYLRAVAFAAPSCKRWDAHGDPFLLADRQVLAVAGAAQRAETVRARTCSRNRACPF